MPLRRSVVLAGLLVLLGASPAFGQRIGIGKSKVYRISVEKVELYLEAASSTGTPGSITARRGLAKAELRLGLEDMNVAAEEFRLSGYTPVAALPASCPAGWFHIHLGGCPVEAFAACTAICWAHPDCGATLAWTPGRYLCSDECDCFPDGTP
jgi:hypothetical protein